MPFRSADAHHRAWAFYGATGVTGRLILERALARGHRPTLIGRDRSRLEAVGIPHGLRTIRADLDQPEELARVLAGHRLVLNAAGPFRVTAEPLAEAAMTASIDYIDVNGELLVLESLLAKGPRAAARGVALVGGAGFGVAAADGLIAQVVGRLGGADSLRISVAADSAFASQGVAQSTLEVIAAGGREIDGGRLVRRGLGRTRWSLYDAQGSPISFASAPLAELAPALRLAPTARVVAGVPMSPGQAFALSLISPFLTALLRMSAVRRIVSKAAGPAAKETKTAYASRVWVDAQAGDRKLTAQLMAGEGFSTAADIALYAVETALMTRPAPGAHTPATAFGAGFTAGVPGLSLRFAHCGDSSAGPAHAVT